MLSPSPDSGDESKKMHVMASMTTRRPEAQWRPGLDSSWTPEGTARRGEGPQVFENCGGLVATRTPDLYRVKVAKSITYG